MEPSKLAWLLWHAGWSSLCAETGTYLEKIRNKFQWSRIFLPTSWTIIRIRCLITKDVCALTLLHNIVDTSVQYTYFWYIHMQNDHTHIHTHTHTHTWTQTHIRTWTQTCVCLYAILKGTIDTAIHLNRVELLRKFSHTHLATTPTLAQTLTHIHTHMHMHTCRHTFKKPPSPQYGMHFGSDSKVYCDPS